MISLIAAVDKNMAIGCNNQLLAYIKPDSQHFKSITKDHIVVMGYKTYLSLPNGPLPNRHNVVLTRKHNKIDGCTVFNDIETLLHWIDCEHKNEEVFIIGGGEIYSQFISHGDKLYLTHIFDEFQCDTYFPSLDNTWEICQSNCRRENIEHKYPHIFTTYTRKTSKTNS